MDRRVLVLDGAYRPHRVVNWQRGVTLALTGRVEVLVEYDYEISSPSITVKVPAVVRLKTKPRSRVNQLRFNRLNVALRDEFCCQYCKQQLPLKSLTYDHVIPRSRGGKTEWTNIVMACRPCNQHKDCRTPEEAGMPHPRPQVPSWLPPRGPSFDDIEKEWIGWI